jgi:hypothetical protein
MMKGLILFTGVRRSGALSLALALSVTKLR